MKGRPSAASLWDDIAVHWLVATRLPADTLSLRREAMAVVQIANNLG